MGMQWLFLYLVEKGGTGQDHGQLAGVVGVVEPGLVVDVPCVEAARETHNTISGLTPYPEREKDAEK